MKKVIFFLMGFFALHNVHAQGWERLYPLGQYNNFGTADLIPTPDGGFLINDVIQHSPPDPDTFSTQYNLRRLGADGALLWTQTNEEVLGARIVAMWPAESNRLLFVTLRNDTTRLVKTDANLQPIWSQVLDAVGQVGYKTRVRTVAGGYAIIYQKNGQQGDPVRIIKTNVNGTLLWQNDYVFTSNFSYQDFATDKQGNLFLFGAGGNPYGAFISKVSGAGTQVFAQAYPQSGFTFSPVLLNDNLLAFLDFQGYLRFLDGNGQATGQLYTGNDVYRIAATSDGKILLASSGSVSKLEKIAPDSTVLWSQVFNNVSAFYDKAPFALWSLPGGGAVSFFIPSSGTLPYYIIRTDGNGLVYTNQLHGNIFADTDDDCVNTPGIDFPAPAISIVAQKGDNYYYATTDTLGNYAMTLDTGTYQLQLAPPGGTWNACTDFLTYTFAAYDTLEWSTGINSTLNCPWPGVDLSAPFLRRCFTSEYHVAYGNSSDVTADSAVVTLTLDTLVAFQSASLPYTSLGNNVFQFYVGDLGPLQTGEFTVQVMIGCSTPLGMTHCSSAEITITNPCPTTGLEIPIIHVEAACEGDSVAFTIKNIGGAPMTEFAQFVVIEDLIVMREGEFQLAQQADIQVKCPANGSTSRIYAGQAPGEPPFFAPTTAIEGCNGPIQPGYWNMFPELASRPTIDRDCQPNIGAFDPNDKQAVPTGYDQEHYIARGVPLDYKIRFQNTGSDTAFTVVVRDTLSAALDAASLRAGSASHPYSWQLLGNGVLEFRFDNILLPDSNVNLAGSMGFVQFHIDQKPDLPLETLIENKAAIYFDFNEPVITNTVWHRIGDNFLPSVATWEPSKPGVLLQVVPNPVGQSARIALEGWDTNQSMEMQLFDAQGRLVRKIAGDEAGFVLQRDNLPAGFYSFQVVADGRVIGRGKMVL